MELDKALLQLFPDIDFFTEAKLHQEAGGEPFIIEWSRSEPQPAHAELDDAWAAWEAGQPARDAAKAAIVTQAMAVETAHGGALAWFESHPNAALLFNLSVVTLDAEIDSLVNDLFPIASAANKNRMKLWMKTVSHAVRALSKREGFT